MIKIFYRTFLIFSILLSCNDIVAQKIVFSPQWTAQAQFAGYYMAQEKGFYKDAGLEVEIVHPAVSASESVLTRLQNKESDVVMLQLLQAVLAYNKDFEIVNILQTSQNNNLVFVMQPEYTDIHQVIGKKIACWTSGFSELAKCMELLNDYQFEWIHFTSGINIFVSRSVDVIIAMEYNEFFQLLNCGKRITDKNVFRFSDQVGNIPEDGLYCLSSTYNKRKTELNLFAEMSKKGWEYARKNPDETLEVVLRIMKEANIPYSRSHQKWMLEKILSSQIDKESGVATYQLEESDYQFVKETLLKIQEMSSKSEQTDVPDNIKNYIPIDFSTFSQNH